MAQHLAYDAQGVALSELTDILLKAILQAIAQNGGDLPGAMMSSLQGGLKRAGPISGVVVTEMSRGASDKVAGAVSEKMGDQAGDAVREAGDSAAEQAGEAAEREAQKAISDFLGRKAGE